MTIIRWGDGLLLIGTWTEDYTYVETNIVRPYTVYIYKHRGPMEHCETADTEFCDRASWQSSNALDLHYDGARFESRPGHRLS
jgi:hypothetical protein